MATSFRETIQLRDVLLSLTYFVTSTKRSVESILSERSGLERQQRNKLADGIRTLEKAHEIASSLVLFFECKMMREADAVALRRHMEDARVLCDTIRVARRETSETDASTVTLQARRADKTNPKDSDEEAIWGSDDEETVCWDEPKKVEKLERGEVKGEKTGRLRRVVRSLSMPLRHSKLVAAKLPCINEGSDARCA